MCGGVGVIIGDSKHVVVILTSSQSTWQTRYSTTRVT